MRKALIFCVLITGIVPCSAQSVPPTPSDVRWSHVQQLKPGTNLRVKTLHARLGCAFVSADAASITCGNKTPNTIQRADILSLSIPHRARSAAVGFGIGAGIGAGVGGGLGTSGGIVGKGGLAAILAVPLAIIGGAIGAATDFTHGTIYKQ